MKNERVDLAKLIKKYNVQVPRYTSYPTVPMWEFDEQTAKKWPEHVKNAFKKSNSLKGISLYIHIPFCESLCTYCGCHQYITVNHSVEEPYLSCVLKEWEQYHQLFDEIPSIKELHLGGGTPTFFSPENLDKLVSSILAKSNVPGEQSFSFEGHPNNTTYEHLDALHKLGFNRVSYGVQDFDEQVQLAINRVQPYENVVNNLEAARKIGYKSVNFDLVYGLPFQTIDVIEDTFNQVLALRPDRIAYYSYAHVPWKRPGQRRYTEEDLPNNEYKRQLYELGKSMLLEAGYKEVGMDHFALPDDELYLAAQAGTLHRNFMGYTVFETDLLLGLGTSSISDAGTAFIQNEKNTKLYQEKINGDRPVYVNGHELSDEDIQIQKVILDLICRNKLSWATYSKNLLSADQMSILSEMQNEGLLKMNNNGLSITERGKPFIRNICHVFDRRHLQKIKKVNAPLYSKSI